MPSGGTTTNTIEETLTLPTCVSSSNKQTIDDNDHITHHRHPTPMSENSDEHNDVRYDDNLLDTYYGELDAFDLDNGAYFGEFVRAEKAERIAKVLMDPHTTPKIIRLYLKNTYIGDYGGL